MKPKSIYPMMPAYRERLPGSVEQKVNWVGIYLIVGLFVSLTFRTYVFTDQFEIRNLSGFTEWMRSNGYYVSGAFLVAVTAYYMFCLPVGVLRLRFVPVYFCMFAAVFFRYKLALLEDEVGGLLQSLLLATMVVLCFGVCLPSALSARVLTISDAVRALFFAGSAWTVFSLSEYLLRPDQVVWGTRFLGISGHPNHAGMITAVSAICGFGVMFYDSSSKWRKIAYLVVFCSLAGLTIWSGSRTALLVLCVGIAALLLNREVTVLMAVGVVAILSIVVVAKLYVDFPEEVGDVRSLTTTNTRQEAWTTMWQMFLDNPWTGIDSKETPSENSLLIVLARTGIIGGLPFLFGLGLVAHRAIALLDPRLFIAEGWGCKVAGAVLVAILVGSFFEGFLKDEFSFPIYATYLLSGVTFGGNFGRIGSIRVNSRFR